MSQQSITLTMQTAQVYKVGRRRWFTKRAAIHAMAREWVKLRCDCEKGEKPEYDGPNMTYPGSPDFVCKYHDVDRYPALMERLYELAPRYAKDEARGSRK